MYICIHELIFTAWYFALVQSGLKIKLSCVATETEMEMQWSVILLMAEE